MGGLWRGGLACVKTYKVLERVKECAGWWKKKSKSRLWFSWASSCLRKVHHSGIHTESTLFNSGYCSASQKPSGRSVITANMPILKRY